MNYDPMKWCYTGRHMALRNSFRTVPGSKPKREICTDCWEKRQVAETLIRERKAVE